MLGPTARQDHAGTGRPSYSNCMGHSAKHHSQNAIGGVISLFLDLHDFSLSTLFHKCSKGGRQFLKIVKNRVAQGP